MGELIKEYLHTSDYHFDQYGAMHDVTVESGIGILVTKGIFTVEEIQKEAGKHDVVLPETFIKECVKNGR